MYVPCSFSICIFYLLFICRQCVHHNKNAHVSCVYARVQTPALYLHIPPRNNAFCICREIRFPHEPFDIEARYACAIYICTQLVCLFIHSNDLHKQHKTHRHTHTQSQTLSAAEMRFTYGAHISRFISHSCRKKQKYCRIDLNAFSSRVRASDFCVSIV